MASLPLTSPLVRRPQFQSRPSTSMLQPIPNFNDRFQAHSSWSMRTRREARRKEQAIIIAASSMEDGVSPQSPPRLVTFIGKGGSGKTTASVFAAQHYASAGLSTCLVTHSQDITAEYLLNCKIGNTPVTCGKNLSAVRLETTKMLLEPLKQIKQADARVNMAQGVLEGIVGEELGVLPGMDSIFSVFALLRFMGPVNMDKRNQNDKFDVIVYDGVSTTETLRMISAPSSTRLYLKYLRNIVDKTDFGRLAGPSLLRLVDEALNTSQSSFNGKLSSEIWVSLERILERGSSIFASPQKFGCYITMDTCNPASVNTALRCWGSAIQSGAQISGAIGWDSSGFGMEELEQTKEKFSPLPFATISDLWRDLPPDWNAAMLNSSGTGARDLLNLLPKGGNYKSSVNFDVAQKCVTLFMPGFDKSEIKLYQYRGGSELLVEAGDQRRVIQLPREVQGKVCGAKFVDRNLIVTMR